MEKINKMLEEYYLDTNDNNVELIVNYYNKKLISENSSKVIISKATFDRYLYEIIHLNEIFKKNGVENIFFKGPLLAFQLYDAPYVRCFRDIDLLVFNYHFDKALILLKRDGYILIDRNNEHHLIFKKSNIRLELHKKIFNPLCNIDETMLLKEKKEYNIIKNNIFTTFNENGTIFQMLLHLYMDVYFTPHFYNALFFKKNYWCNNYIFRVYEIALFIYKYNYKIDWKQIEKMFSYQKLQNKILKKIFEDINIRCYNIIKIKIDDNNAIETFDSNFLLYYFDNYQNDIEKTAFDFMIIHYNNIIDNKKKMFLQKCNSIFINYTNLETDFTLEKVFNKYGNNAFILEFIFEEQKYKFYFFPKYDSVHILCDVYDVINGNIYNCFLIPFELINDNTIRIQILLSDKIFSKIINKEYNVKLYYYRKSNISGYFIS